MAVPQSTPAPNLPQEEWRPVVGWEGWYDVSSLGRVRRVRPAPGTQAGRVMKLVRGRGDYPTACLCRHSAQQTVYVHHLVAAAFLGPRPEGKEINHRDRDRWNACVQNLEYVTASENQRHARALGFGRALGERNAEAKLTVEAVRAIRASSETQRTLALRYGVSQGVVSMARRGVTWGHVRGEEGTDGDTTAA